MFFLKIIVRYEVREMTADGEDKLVALFLHDNYMRINKRSGAWMSEFRSQSRNAGIDGAHVIPIVVCALAFSSFLFLSHIFFIFLQQTCMTPECFYERCLFVLCFCVSDIQLCPKVVSFRCRRRIVVSLPISIVTANSFFS